MKINNSIFLIIDVQEKLVNAMFNKNELVKKSEIIAKVAKILNIPVVLTEQYPKGLGTTINDVSANISATSKCFEKFAFNALCHEDFSLYLDSVNRKNIVLFGIETHICVYQTAKALIENGYNVTVIKDGCGSRAESEHFSALNNLQKIGCDIKTTEMVIFELLESAKHPNFKEIQNLIK